MYEENAKQDDIDKSLELSKLDLLNDTKSLKEIEDNND